MNIALFLPNWIGDVVMATPAIRALRDHFQDANFIGVCRTYVSEVLAGSPWLDKTLVLDRRGAWANRWAGVAWKLRRAKVDLAVLFPNSFRSALVARLAGAKLRIGFDRYLRGSLLTHRLDPKRDAQGRLVPCPIIDDYNRLAETTGCAWPGHRLELHTLPHNERDAERAWQNLDLGDDQEVVCLNPGAAFGSAKHWHAESFARLAQDLCDQRGSRVLVLCGPSERDLSRQIVRLAARPTVHSLADEPLSIGLTKALVRRCNLLVTTDSGPRHFAAAFERPVITLFGPTHIAWTETYYAQAVHLQKKVPCGPCQLRVCPVDHRCMKELTPAEVFAAVNDLMARVAHGRPLPITARESQRRAS
jgi:heptosyltransferase II